MVQLSVGVIVSDLRPLDVILKHTCMSPSQKGGHSCHLACGEEAKHDIFYVVMAISSIVAALVPSV